MTGRKEGFDTLRDMNGMSGFPKRKESPYDAFNTGHSSTSVSAGLGMVRARDLLGGKNYVVSVIGDGSMTGGMAFEALNDASQLKTNFIVILNDNAMSIGKNVGGMSRYLTRIRTARGYNRIKLAIKRFLSRLPIIGENMVERISNAKDSIKEIVVPSGMYFENMGLTYLGPVDGHNVLQMEKAFKAAKELDKCVLIHVKTVKGKGYEPAEKHSDDFHGVEPFDIVTGKPLAEKTGKSYSDVFGDFMADKGGTEPRLVGITAAMSGNVGLRKFESLYPDRCFDVGIAEQHAVTMAAGLAASGMKPVAAIFSSFLQRAYDQIVHDVCMQDLPVVFAIDRAGIVGRDGETHHGAFDLSYLGNIPNMTLMAPMNGTELKEMLDLALSLNAPAAVRYPRGQASEIFSDRHVPVEYGKAEVIQKGSGIALLSFGDMMETAEEARKKLAEQGLNATLVNMRFVKPIDEDCLIELSKTHHTFVTLENGVISGGAGEKCAAFLEDAAPEVRMIHIGIPDRFVPHGDTKDLMALLGMDADSIVKRIDALKNEGTT
ncbi:MAG: 1-deoxy-D-xylulose-5-phosphate synthase [Lachnospiraceae bacterium]|nr:1-deoxy-D-xylulose-5-phosphate synthase [Lachnospiraceae bacterium]